MSNYIGYKEEDNIRRKKNNMSTSECEIQVSKRTKKYTTFGSSMTDHLQKKYAKEFTSEVKVYTKQELAEFAKERGLNVHVA